MHSPHYADPEITVLWNYHSSCKYGVTTEKRFDLRTGDRFNLGISPRGEFNPKAKDIIGALEVFSSNIFMSNFTNTMTYVVENMEGGTELVKVSPRQLRMVLPFEISKISILSQSGIINLKVFGRPPRLIETENSIEVSRFPLGNLDTNSKYFAVLVAMCEPRLRGDSMAALPSVQEIVDRLKATQRFNHANRSSVNYHIDYLVNQKLSVTEWAKHLHDGRLHSKREALVAFALRFDLVREEHLDLLPKQTSFVEHASAVPLGKPNLKDGLDLTGRNSGMH